MFKKVYDLTYTKHHRFVVYKRMSIFGILISKEAIASFADPETAIKYFKTLI